MATANLTQRAHRLELFTVGWNVIEAVVGIGAGVLAGSPSLIGFGLDSVVESSSGVVMLWRLRDLSGAREETARRLVGWSLLILATYVFIDAGRSLLFQERPTASIVGILLATVSLVVMPLLARAKRNIAFETGMGSLAADSRQTDFCAYLSAVLLVGLVLNAWLEWWWADPIGALLLSSLIAWEGRGTLKGENCGCVGPLAENKE